MKTKSMLVAAALAACLTSCYTVNKREVTAVYFGPVPSDYQQQVKNLMATQLKDSPSAIYHFGTPRKGFDQDGLLLGSQKHFGWIVPVNINTRNSSGAYIGEQPYYFFFAATGGVVDCTIVMGMMAKYIE